MKTELISTAKGVSMIKMKWNVTYYPGYTDQELHQNNNIWSKKLSLMAALKTIQWLLYSKPFMACPSRVG